MWPKGHTLKKIYNYKIIVSKFNINLNTSTKYSDLDI
nr:MAG TPA: hypothetical protein [Caudoviricetes sp.]